MLSSGSALFAIELVASIKYVSALHVTQTGLTQNSTAPLGLSANMNYTASRTPLSRSTRKLTFTTIARGNSSGVKYETKPLLNNEADWKDFWREHVSDMMSPPPLEHIDFAEEMVICIYLGTQSTGGYGVEIKSIEDIGDDLVVKFETSSPSGMAKVRELTQPHHIVRVARSDKPIHFEGSEASPPSGPSTFMLMFNNHADKKTVMEKIKTLDIVQI